jgi:hypothetical protein
MLPRQAKKRCVVVVNRDLDIGKGSDGHEAKQLDAPLAGAAVDFERRWHFYYSVLNDCRCSHIPIL